MSFLKKAGLINVKPKITYVFPMEKSVVVKIGRRNLKTLKKEEKITFGALLENALENFSSDWKNDLSFFMDKKTPYVEGAILKGFTINQSAALKLNELVGEISEACDKVIRAKVVEYLIKKEVEKW